MHFILFRGVTELRVEVTVESSSYDSVILVVSPEQNISSRILSSVVSAALELDSALKTEVAVLPVPIPAKRLVYSPTG